MQERGERMELPQYDPDSHRIDYGHSSAYYEQQKKDNTTGWILVAIIAALLIIFLYQAQAIANTTIEQHTNNIQIQQSTQTHSQVKSTTQEANKPITKKKPKSAKKKLQSKNERYIVPLMLIPRKPQGFKYSENVDVVVVDGVHQPTFEHRNDWRLFTYPTVGIPTPKERYNSTKITLPEQLYDFDIEINKIFKPYNDTDCQYARMGEDTGSGGYVVCKNYIKAAQGVINIGINGTDKFGCDISAWSNLPVYQYDCLGSAPQACNNENAKCHFKSICLGEQTEQTPNHTFYALEDMFKANKLYKKQVFLKINVGGGQYAGLKYFPTQYLQYINQMVVEFHLSPLYPEQWGMLDIFRTLNQHFVSVNYHMNNKGCWLSRQIKSNIFTVTLVNKKLIKLKSSAQSYKLNPQNKEVAPQLPTCNIL